MMRSRFENKVSAAVTLGLALSLPLSVSAQAPSGPGLSSGSGAGTGTGSSSAIGRNPSGSISGVGPALRGGVGDRVPQPGRVLLQPPGFSVPLGPGATTTFPDDTTLFPFSTFSEESGRTTPPNLSEVQPRELTFARSITDPGERCLTLHKVAGVAVFGNQLELAHRALGEAADAALQIQDPITHDLRLLALINGLNNLSEALLREGKMDLTLPDFEEDPPAALEKAEVDRELLIRRAELEWSRAAHLAHRIYDPTYQTESLYRVVESQSYGAQTIINEFPHSPPKDQPPPAERPGAHPLDVLADKLFASAAVYAQQISRPVWRDRALVAASTAAALGRQFDRAIQIARLIPQPEVRSDALMKIAESEARRDDPGATAAYHEAAEAIASMPIDDPRGILAGVLVDSLISVGRFEDARRSVVLLPTEARRLEALGAVAESQGFRGASETAIEWITKEAAPEQRPHLYRKLRIGVLAAIEQNRSRDISNRER